MNLCKLLPWFNFLKLKIVTKIRVSWANTDSYSLYRDKNPFENFLKDSGNYIQVQTVQESLKNIVIVVINHQFISSSSASYKRHDPCPLLYYNPKKSKPTKKEVKCIHNSTCSWNISAISTILRKLKTLKSECQYQEIKLNI